MRWPSNLTLTLTLTLASTLTLALSLTPTLALTLTPALALPRCVRRQGALRTARPWASCSSRCSTPQYYWVYRCRHRGCIPNPNPNHGPSRNPDQDLAAWGLDQDGAAEGVVSSGAAHGVTSSGATWQALNAALRGQTRAEQVASP